MNTVRQSSPLPSLAELLSDCPEMQGLLDDSVAGITVSGLNMDSRQLKAGEVFVALFGKNHDARDYIDVAISKGCVAVLADAGGDWHGLRMTGKVPVLAIDNLRRRIGELAARFYNYPSRRLPVIGVTGTNGKTSCTQFIAQILAGLDKTCGVIGTMGYGVFPQLCDTGFTTPDAIVLQQALSDVVRNNAKVVAMEVSSQGLHQHRVSGTVFNSAVFTNLTRDHLDYHGSMAAYAEAKRKLFEHEDLRVAVINADDSYAATMLNALPRSAQSFTYSLHSKRADVFAEELTFTADGFQAIINSPWGIASVTGHLLGAFNFSNILAALTAVMTLPEEMDFQSVVGQIASLRPVNGRMELIGNVDGVSAVVDYAHTPDGLRCALEAARQHTRGQIWCVFGCGGNRDQGKRPLMAEVADQLADQIIVTDDNPRNENADDIVRQIMFGFSDKSRVAVERDRARAIESAIRSAKAGDLVLIAGKGHECYQDVAGQKMAFSDAAQVRLALQDRAAEAVKGGGVQ
ncbi:UDP-N-acetylmuramoyl-L-alanyl-D-glutamate--2,6-diaminopimelate ligase [Pseudohongiella spirulinae]|uniref:UDP-N-acetylmuramoyl-L-alanyl-D-glutamate--2,6-diaminopimelate ligase n=1 Tax=Pseudohongiella spirulinae TaxID=1249552 RepID=A0A0S2KF00_9GAMM|nr:UDP-N-acetylmuramoyl-L-alanyl-D-glutamate--2,6-diaminopimelate ligase [Pseudohongiella spirulinae]ALO46935.1 UDP-N-acetylmuramoyl-L-alanyl-D-glutamate--2,6-diaminopimelate ligase [Pseudohongiella spirulinae]